MGHAGGLWDEFSSDPETRAGQDSTLSTPNSLLTHTTWPHTWVLSSFLHGVPRHPDDLERNAHFVDADNDEIGGLCQNGSVTWAEMSVWTQIVPCLALPPDHSQRWILVSVVSLSSCTEKI